MPQLAALALKPRLVPALGLPPFWGRLPPPLFVTVGLIGGYTTFSAFSLQVLDLLRSGAILRGALVIVLSVSLCLGAVALGHELAASLNDGATRIAQNDVEEASG